MIDNEFRVWGPPGTGKTTYLGKQIEAAVKAHGGENVLVASFTRAAAAELVSRGLPIPRERIGTMHAHCYRSLGEPDLATKFIKSWNTAHPYWSLTGEGVDLDEGDAGIEVAGDGDMIFQKVQLFRSQMLPVEMWPSDTARMFYKNWCDWKKTEHLMDFTDLIETTIKDGGAAPGNPVVGFYDEVQDFSRLEIELVRTWGKHMDRVVMSGDDDQALYRFKGSDPEMLFADPVPAENRRVLAQSWRVPRAVHSLANAWVKELSWREEKEYLPRDFDGFVGRWDTATCQAPDEAVEDAVRWTEAGYRVMFLASCSYMLQALTKRFHALGVPFHNPYRRNRRGWNPLGQTRGKSSVDRFLAFLRPQPEVWGEQSRIWTREELQMWVEMLKKAAVSSTSRDLIDLLPETEDEVPVQKLELIFGEVAEQAFGGDLGWFGSNLLAARSKALEFPFRVAEARGAIALRETPRIVVGTIHSVKGGQADIVYLWPDLSNASYKEGDSVKGRDDLIRMFYVGMTRARVGLFLCGPSSQTFKFDLASKVKWACRDGGYDLYAGVSGPPSIEPVGG